MPVRGAYKEKLQQMNQETTQMKNASQLKPFTNEWPLRVTIFELYLEELKQLHPVKPPIKNSTKQKFSSYTKKKENGQNEIEKIKADIP